MFASIPPMDRCATWTLGKLGFMCISHQLFPMEKTATLKSLQTLYLTVMDKSIDTPACFPENASFLPEKYCNYKFLGIQTFIYVHWNYKKEQRRKDKFHIILHRKTPLLNIWLHTLWKI